MKPLYHIKQLIKSRLILLAAVLSTLSLTAQQTDIKNQIQEIPYVFEGIIEKVEIYAGDKEGNRLPDNSTKRENGLDYFYQSDGSQAIGYSLVTIKLCKIYKGSDIESEERVHFLTGSSQLTVYKQDGQVRYMYFPPTHSTEMIHLPTSIGGKTIFFCKKDTKGYFSIFDRSIGIGISENYERDKAKLEGEGRQVVYAMGLNKTFYSKEELNAYLSTIPTLNVNPKDKCISTEKKSLNGIEEISEPEIKINYQQNLQNYNSWLAQILERNKQPKIKKIQKLPPRI